MPIPFLHRGNEVRRHLRWTLRTQLLLVGFASVLMSAFACYWHHVRQQREAVDYLRGWDVFVRYDGPCDSEGNPAGRWQCALKDYINSPVEVELYCGGGLTAEEGRQIGASLSKLKHLVTMNAQYIPQEDFDKIAPSCLQDLADLEVLSACGPSAVLYLEKLPSLSSVSIHPAYYLRAYDHGITRGENRFWTDEQRAALGRLRQVRYLSVIMGNDDVRALAPLTELEALDLRGGRFDGSGLSQLRSLRSLRWLCISGTGGVLSDESLKSLQDLESVEVLKLPYEKNVKGHALSYLGRMKRLQRLDLSCTGIDDSSLMRLAPLRTLRELFLTSDRITPDGARRFHHARSDVKVFLDGEQVVTRGKKEN